MENGVHNEINQRLLTLEEWMSQPLFILIGADKGGVGKTTVARALIDYIKACGAKVRVFDSETPDGDLKRFHSDANIIDIGKVSDQMTIFDNLSTDLVTVVDVRANMLSPTLKALDESGMLDDVRNNKVKFAILHVIGNSVASLNEILTIAAKLGPGAQHFLVENAITETGLGELAEDSRYAEALKKAEGVTIHVPRMTEIVCDKIQQLGVSFADFTREKTAVGEPSPYSRIQRGYAQTWLDKVWKEFARVGLGELLRLSSTSARSA
jgi:hypothetical protein